MAKFLELTTDAFGAKAEPILVNIERVDWIRRDSDGRAVFGYRDIEGNYLQVSSLPVLQPFDEVKTALGLFPRDQMLSNGVMPCGTEEK